MVNRVPLSHIELVRTGDAQQYDMAVYEGAPSKRKCCIHSRQHKGGPKGNMREQYGKAVTSAVDVSLHSLCQGAGMRVRG
jgi:hypothetical protein